MSYCTEKFTLKNSIVNVNSCLPILFNFCHKSIDFRSRRRPRRGGQRSRMGGGHGGTSAPCFAQARQFQRQFFMLDHLQLGLLLELSDFWLQGLYWLRALVAACYLLPQLSLGLRMLALQICTSRFRLPHLLQCKTTQTHKTPTITVNYFVAPLLFRKSYFILYLQLLAKLPPKEGKSSPRYK